MYLAIMAIPLHTWILQILIYQNIYLSTKRDSTHTSAGKEFVYNIILSSEDFSSSTWWERCRFLQQHNSNLCSSALKAVPVVKYRTEQA